MLCCRSMSFRLKTHSERHAAVLATSLSFCKGWGLYTRCRCINIWYIHIQAPPKSALWLWWWIEVYKGITFSFSFYLELSCVLVSTLCDSSSMYWVAQITLVSVSCKHIFQLPSAHSWCMHAVAHGNSEAILEEPRTSVHRVWCQHPLCQEGSDVLSEYSMYHHIHPGIDTRWNA